MSVLLGMVLLAGCSSLPTLSADPSARSLQTVQLRSAQGPVSAARSADILSRLAQGSPSTGIFERHLAREDAIAGSPLTTANQVRLLQDGPATYQAMLAAIEAATDHINLETYILEDDEIGQIFAQALIRKQRQGVQVNLIRDSAGTVGTPEVFFQTMADAGIQVLEFNPVNPLRSREHWSPNQRDHRKLLITDGRVAIMGGINISSVYARGSFPGRGSSGRTQGRITRVDAASAWRDTDLQLQGPVVAELQKLFLATWAAQRGPALAPRHYFPPPQNAGPHLVRAIGSSPDEAFSQIYATLLSAIGAAETSISLTNAYFAPDPQLLDALEGAVKRGVTVTLILPGRTDFWLVFHAGRRYYERLLRAGVRIHERREALLHSKTALIDGLWTTVGSTNLDWRSFLHNQELNAVVLSPSFGAQVQQMFDRDLAASDPISLERWQQRPASARLKEWLASWWEYWL